MCQYQAEDGIPNDWHLVHYGARAAGGFGLLIIESTAVTPDGRISPNDVGLWNDEQAAAWQPITAFIHKMGAKCAVQLAHAGRKAGVYPAVQTEKKGPIPGWDRVSPGTEPFANFPAPRALTTEEIAEIPALFAAAAVRAVTAGFDAVEIHAAHGYLLHSFVSPLTNTREDRYGERSLLLREVCTAVKAAVDVPVLVRVSASDFCEGGLQIEDTVELAKQLRDCGVSLIDVSGGGLTPFKSWDAIEGEFPGFASRIGKVLPVASVGGILNPAQGERMLREGIDAALIGRAALWDASWPMRAGVTPPPSYAQGVRDQR